MVLMGPRKNVASASGTNPKSRASIACKTCRLRKVKCDASSFETGQICTPCRRAGQECLLDPTSDGRRSVSWKHVGKLQQRIRTLEALAQQVDGVGMVISEERQGHDANELNPSSFQQAPQSPKSSMDLLPRDSEGRRPLESFATHHQMAVPINPDCEPSQGRPSKDLSGFFGSTSHPHVNSPVDHSCQSSIDDAEELHIDVDPNSPQLRNVLIQSFFKYQTLWVEVVNREIFLNHRRGLAASRWYCDFLEYAILACATRLTTSKAVRSLGPEYIQLAKSEVLNALSEPTPAALQAFLLLSEYEVTHGNDRSGWMFCGMACRMLSDVGLHDIADVDRTSNGPMTLPTEESNLAYALLSACVVYEGVWTLYLGRPSSIAKSIMEVAALRCKSKLPSDSSMLNAWVGLCVPMAEISHILNDNQSHIDSRTSSLSLSQLIHQMQDWYDNLEQELTYDDGRLTDLDMAGFGLHTQYCKVQILLRQALQRSPGYFREPNLSQVVGDALPTRVIESSSEVVYHYSLRIARLVVTYREVFGVEKIPSIMLDNAIVAATALIKRFNATPNSSDIQHRDLIWIRSLVKCLEAVQLHFPITKRMLDALKHMSKSSSLTNMIFLSAPPTKSGDIIHPTCSAPATNPLELCEMDPNLVDNNVDITDPLLECLGMDGNPNMYFWGGVSNLFSGVPT